VRKADNLTTFICRKTRNLEASKLWNPQDLSRPEQGLFYISRDRLYLNQMQPLFAGNINSPFGAVGCRHHPVRTDDWTATYMISYVLVRHL